MFIFAFESMLEYNICIIASILSLLSFFVKLSHSLVPVSRLYDSKRK